MKAPKRLTEAERDQLLLRLPVIERALAELLARSKPKKMPIDDTDRALVSALFNTFSTDVFTRRDAIEHAAVNPHLKKALIDCNCDPGVGPDLAAHELQYVLRRIRGEQPAEASHLHLQSDRGEWSFMPLHLEPWR